MLAPKGNLPPPAGHSVTVKEKQGDFGSLEVVLGRSSEAQWDRSSLQKRKAVSTYQAGQVRLLDAALALGLGSLVSRLLRK